MASASRTGAFASSSATLTRSARASRRPTPAPPRAGTRPPRRRATALAALSDRATARARFEEAEDRIIRLATTLNAYEDVAITSRSTNMGTFVYEQLSLVPEEHRWMLIDELTSQGIVNCWFIAGLLYKVKLAEREATGPMDISNDLEEYQERLERLAEEEESERDGERAGRLFASASGSSRDEDEYDDDADDADARRDAAFDAARAGVQVFEGRAANVPGGPLIDRFQKVFYPAPEDPGTWHGRVAVKKPRIVEKYLPLYFRTNDTLERFVKVPATAEDADLLLDYQNPPYLEADMPPGMAYPSRMTAGEGKAGTWWPIPKMPIPPFDTLVDYLRPIGPGVYAGRGWRGGGDGDEFLTFILVRRYDVPASP